MVAPGIKNSVQLFSLPDVGGLQFSVQNQFYQQPRRTEYSPPRSISCSLTFNAGSTPEVSKRLLPHPQLLQAPFCFWIETMSQQAANRRLVGMLATLNVTRDAVNVLQ